MLSWREPDSYMTPQHCQLPHQVRMVPSGRKKMHRNHWNEVCPSKVGQTFKRNWKLQQTLMTGAYLNCGTIWVMSREQAVKAREKMLIYTQVTLCSNCCLCPVFVFSHNFFLMTSLGFICIHIRKPFDHLVLLSLPFTRIVKGRIIHKTHSKATHLWGLPYSTVCLP